MIDDMKLPTGKQCFDCRYFKHCAGFIGIKGTETHCDWSPSRFVPHAVIPTLVTHQLEHPETKTKQEQP